MYVRRVDPSALDVRIIKNPGKDCEWTFRIPTVLDDKRVTGPKDGPPSSVTGHLVDVIGDPPKSDLMDLVTVTPFKDPW